MNRMTRPRSIALRAAILAVLLGGACGSSSTAKPDGGGSDGGGGDHLTSSSPLVGTIDPNAPPTCITTPLQLVGGQAQCTVVQHLTGTGGEIDTTIPSCDVSQAPCWSLITSPGSCSSGGLTFAIDPDPANPSPDPGTLSYGYSCVRAN